MGWLEHPTSRGFRDGRSNHVVLPAFARIGRLRRQVSTGRGLSYAITREGRRGDLNTRPPTALAAGALPVVPSAFAAADSHLPFISVRSGPQAMTTRVMKRRPPCGRHLLYPLSYGSRMENPAGFEPATWRVIACSSIGIRHGPRAAFPLFRPGGCPPGRRCHSSTASMARTHWSGWPSLRTIAAITSKTWSEKPPTFRISARPLVPPLTCVVVFG